MKKVAAMILAMLLISSVSLAQTAPGKADEVKKAPGTIASFELLGPHYIWNLEGKVPKATNPDRQIESVSPQAEQRIKEQVDKNNQGK